MEAILSIEELSAMNRLRIIAELRNAEAEARAAYSAARQSVLDAFDAEHKEEAENLAALSSELQAQTNALKEMVTAEYESNPEHVKSALGQLRWLREEFRKQFEFDAQQAFDWAKAKGICLSFDAKAFRDLCKSDSNRPAFVGVGETITVTLATDLNEALKEAA